MDKNLVTSESLPDSYVQLAGVEDDWIFGLAVAELDLRSCFWGR